jgi:glucose/mannose-6-phosphate isomerase
MDNLDRKEKFEEYDKGKILASIRLLPDQMEQAWEEVCALNIPEKYFNSKNVVICGMGGSALGGRIIDSLLSSRVNVPIEIFTEYDIPYYANKDTLLIASSYSGNTEETINVVNEAELKNADVFIITTGGKLAEMAKEKNIPAYIYEPRSNPSGQPRMGLGYSIFSILAILSKLKMLHIQDHEVFKLATQLREVIKDFDIDTTSHENVAKNFSKKLTNKLPVIVSSEHLKGVTHAFKNQLNENSKTFSVIFDIPELNHHLMEGLAHPKKAREILQFVFFESVNYRPEIRKRYKVTQDVIQANGYPYNTYSSKTKDKLEEIFEILIFGSFVSFYLAYLNNEDVSEIPWVDYFKAKLQKI